MQFAVVTNARKLGPM